MKKYIAAVRSIKRPDGTMGKIIFAFSVLCGGLFIYLGAPPLIGISMIVVGLFCLLLKDKYCVQVDSGGTPTIGLETPIKEKADEIVEEINKALLDLDNTENSSSNSQTEDKSLSADELKKLKNLLDEGVITQKEFDKKKKEILGL